MASTVPPPTASDVPPADTRPWWRHGFVWLVISGPLVVVVAGFITLWIAIRTPDPVVPSAELPRALLQQRMGDGHGSMAPAQAVRNHTAATLGETP